MWVVLLKTGARDEIVAYGPIDDANAASGFADFLTSEVDPAFVRILRSPTLELLSFWRNRKAGMPSTPGRPEYWPPEPGQIWQDRNKDRWIGTGTPNTTSYLVCLARQADDNAEEIWRLYGPMTFVQSVETTETEVPF